MVRQREPESSAEAGYTRPRSQWSSFPSDDGTRAVHGLESPAGSQTGRPHSGIMRETY